MAEIIKIADHEGKSKLRHIIDELIAFDEQDLLTDLVLTYRRAYTLEEQQMECNKGYSGSVCRYWFGDTSGMYCLGLNQNMSYIISAWVNGVDLIDGD